MSTACADGAMPAALPGEEQGYVIVKTPLIPLATEIGANRSLKAPKNDWERGYDAAMEWCLDLVKNRTDRMGLPTEVPKR